LDDRFVQGRPLGGLAYFGAIHKPKQRRSVRTHREARGSLMKFVFLVVLFTGAAAIAQTPPPPPQTPLLTIRTTLVLVPALVQTREGAPVFTLNAADFTLTDDGIEQKIKVDEDTGSEPLALVIAVETGGAGARQLNKYRHLGPSIEAVIGSVPHKVAVVEFDSTPRLTQKFTPDLNAMEASLQNIGPGDHGAAILDGLRFSVDLLRRQPSAYRRAILLISETADHGSKNNLDEALHAVSDTNTSIYSLAFSSAKSAAGHEAALTLGDPTPGPPGGCMAKDPDAPSEQNRLEQAYECFSLLAPPLRLAKVASILAKEALRYNVPESVAQLTGGEYFRFTDARSLERGVLAISHHLPNRYVLSYHPTAPHAGFHTIGLRMNDYPDLVVQARTGYWVEKDTVAAFNP
jgi:VWFA-related protein